MDRGAWWATAKSQIQLSNWTTATISPTAIVNSVDYTSLTFLDVRGPRNLKFWKQLGDNLGRLQNHQHRRHKIHALTQEASLNFYQSMFALSLRIVTGCVASQGFL